VLQDVDLDVRRGEVVTIIGPSGGGKTTLLRCINLLEVYDAGSIRIDGVEVGYRESTGASRTKRSERELSPIRAQTGMVFQLFYLFPHLSAVENVMLGLTKVRRLSKPEARRIAETWPGRAGAQAGKPAVAALGRPAAARGDRPCGRDGAQGAPTRRDHLRTRPRAGR
jgi:polar amino acid transport system ATP-binding protein